MVVCMSHMKKQVGQEACTSWPAYSPHKDQVEWGLEEISLYFNLSSFAADYYHPTSLAISILCWSPCRTKLKTTFVKVVTTLPEVVKPVYVYPAPDCDFQTAQYLFTSVTWPPWPTQCFPHIPQRDNTVHSHYVTYRSPPYVALLRFSKCHVAFWWNISFFLWLPLDLLS